MRYYYDTEFDEDGTSIELISIAIVAEDGRELYRVVEDADWERINKNQWVMEHVIPLLPTLGEPEWQLKDTIRKEVYDFLYPYQPVPGEVQSIGYVGDPELWAWFGAYDHVVLAQMFGKMAQFPAFIPQWTNDLRQEVHRLKNPALPKQRKGEHDALEDARQVKRWADWLAGKFNSKAGTPMENQCYGDRHVDPHRGCFLR
ncbi:hypothetical protein CJ179_38915 [Rhodococcus sp. ACS1]|uniref:3'-5' exoribonuclease domain-containing protein n=1 Tax=Rhodococcus sp. ACS1 TaxID=2028570 RepID=UPI000BB140E4|nr:3'-5' exoribonuclease [Rhodococcus sp. ACS1]PBC38569.1 hypothetical protein CJ179_38915 [Rhodococcus sp. ACS1]